MANILDLIKEVEEMNVPKPYSNDPDISQFLHGKHKEYTESKKGQVRNMEKSILEASGDVKTDAIKKKHVSGWYPNKEEKSRIISIRNTIEGLLSPENLMEPSRIKELQHMLNKYIYGENRIMEDGMFGKQTTKAIRDYQQQSRYWGGHSTVIMNPLEAGRLYERSLKYDYEDPREGLSLIHI